MLHKETVWYGWININLKGGALVKCLLVLMIHLPHEKMNQLIIKWRAIVLLVPATEVTNPLQTHMKNVTATLC
jgi:hypothetical protein